MIIFDESRKAIELAFLRDRLPRLPDAIVELLGTHGTWTYLESLAEEGWLSQEDLVDRMYNLGRDGNLADEWRLAVVLSKRLRMKVETVFPESAFEYPAERTEIKKLPKPRQPRRRKNVEEAGVLPREPVTLARSKVLGCITDNDLDLLPKNLAILPAQLQKIINGDFDITRGGAYTPEFRAAHFLVNFHRQAEGLSVMSPEDMAAAMEGRKVSRERSHSAKPEPS